MKRLKTAYHARRRRHLRIRKKIRGTAERPRLSVYRSLSHIYAQLIDDVSGKTLISASSIEQSQRAVMSARRKSEAAKAVGQLVGQRAVELGIAAVVFDRGGHNYHGRVKALADAAREAGLSF